MSERPMLYYIEYTNRLRWERLHLVPGEPADPVDFRDFIDVKTLGLARREAARLLERWPFAQPVIHRRTAITPVSWDYSSEVVEPEAAP